MSIPTIEVPFGRTFVDYYPPSVGGVDYSELGRRLAAARVYRGLSVSDVADRARALGHARGYGRSRISEIENARGVLPVLRDLQVFASIYDVDVQVFTEVERGPFTAGPVKGSQQADERLARLEARVNEMTNLVERTMLDVARLRSKNDETPA